jgi:hypothetical protein
LFVRQDKYDSDYSEFFDSCRLPAGRQGRQTAVDIEVNYELSTCLPAGRLRITNDKYYNFFVSSRPAGLGMTK